MLIKRYLNSVSKVQAIMAKIIEGTAPEKFTNAHLKKIGFGASNDRTMVPLLKDLGFLSAEGVPTQRYHDYRNTARSKQVLGETLKEAYTEIFHITANPTQSDKLAIAGLFKSTHNVSDQVAGFMANTFLVLLEIADIAPKSEPKKESAKQQVLKQSKESKSSLENVPQPVIPQQMIPNLRYNIEIHLPATKEIEVYNAIFKSLKEHLLDD